MSLSNLLKKRFSVRAFLDKPVSEKILQKIFTDAQLSPSNCNVQPWRIHVVSGAKKDELKDKLVEELMSGKEPNPDFDWRVRYKGIHRDRQFESANALYSSMGIERSDKQSRLTALIRNWTFFDAPHALFFTMEKYLNIMGAVDIGIYAQTLAMLMNENGIANCFQGALGQFPDPVRKFLHIPDNFGILFGMAFGYADEKVPVNTTRTDRVPIENSVVFWE
jgi:nitroreductase